MSPSASRASEAAPQPFCRPHKSWVYPSSKCTPYRSQDPVACPHQVPMAEAKAASGCQADIKEGEALERGAGRVTEGQDFCCRSWQTSGSFRKSSPGRNLQLAQAAAMPLAAAISWDLLPPSPRCLASNQTPLSEVC